MVFTVMSKIEKGMIRLPKKVKIPEGTKVIVKIEPALKSGDKRKIISALCGSWEIGRASCRERVWNCG